MPLYSYLSGSANILSKGVRIPHPDFCLHILRMGRVNCSNSNRSDSPDMVRETAVDFDNFDFYHSFLD